MKRTPASANTAVLVAAILLSYPARGQQPAAAGEPVLRSTTDEVILDLIIRDKHGKGAREVEPSDLQIVDNGVPRKINSFRLVEGKEALSKTGNVTLDPLRQIRLVTLVFERLGVDGRRFARSAALDLVKTELGPNVFYSVFTIDQHLSALQPFTNDRDKLRKAIEHATSGAYSEYTSDSDRIKHDLESQLGGPVSANGGNAVEAVNSADPGAQNQSSQMMARMMLQMLQFEESMSRDQQGRSSIFSLMSIVREQHALPGRKTVLYFSEGLQIPQNLIEQFHSVIGAANRANVSVYAIDARGLLIENQGGRSRSDLSEAAASTKHAITGEGAVTRDEVMALDKAQDSIRANVQTALAELAEGTGGFLISNTNDYRGPLRKVNEDINSYYEVTYNPGIENYDGKFRKIIVKTDKSDLKIQTRSGYFAFPPNLPDVVNPFEVPLLKALNSPPFPKAIAYQADALHFQSAPNGVKCAVVVEVPLKNIQFTPEAERAFYKAHLSVLVLVKDKSGAVVQKFTRDLPLEGPNDRREAVQQGNFIYQQTFTVPAGRYTLESAILDQEANKISAKKASFLAKAAPASGITMSSISIVRRFDPKAVSTELDDPFHFETGKITPTLSSEIKAGKGSVLSLYFVVYPDKSLAEKPSLIMDFLEDGKPVARVTPELPSPDASGRIAYVASTPSENMKPGQYEVRTIVKQGSTLAMETTPFTVE